MGKEAEVPNFSKLYGQLSADGQAAINKVIMEKLKSIIGGYGELNVLSEYITVMLQSSRPSEQIQSELEAFLQDQSVPFTAWLGDIISKKASEAAPEEGTKRRRKRAEREAAAAETAAPAPADAAERKKQRREKRSAVAVATAAAAGAPPARSRSRRRKRRHGADADAEAANGSAAPAERKAKLTPNVEYLREAYHAPPKDQPAPDRAAPADTRWSFRADGTAGAAPQAGATSLGPPPGHHYPPPHQYFPAPTQQSPHHYHYSAPAGAPHATQTAPAPERVAPVLAPTPPSRHFVPKKWKVVRANTVVRQTEKLDSDEVQKLQEGEIVEQVAPAFKTDNGLIRIQIRHPSSPFFPNPIGWVTQDASAAGGPKFLEPGPEPMQKPAASTWRPPAWSSPWRPRGSIPPPRPAAGKGPYTQNLTWKPSSVAAGG
mmetsp:Transcript_22003/g.39426  ORF Transcript_22003/g.39426 Transcript_22003/m.39426 type:complete len:431 (+) Transcript_22003:72-1364(+)